MVSHKEKVSLIVEGDDLPSFELGLVVGKKAPEEATGTVPNPSIEIVQDKFGVVVRARTMVLYILPVHDI